MAKPYSFAYLTSLLTNQMAKELYLGIKETLSDHNITLTTFCGGALSGEAKGEHVVTSNAVYALAKQGDFDGIIVYGGAIGQFVSTDQMELFCKQFDQTPLLNISLRLPTTPSVVISNYFGMYQLVEHIIRTHHCAKIAFIQGPMEHEEAVDRFRAFCDALQANNLSIDRNDIFTGDYSTKAGRDAVDKIISEKRGLPDAIVCVDDDTALGVIDTLKSYSIKVPSDVIVTGFDDAVFSKSSSPTITTVQQSFYSLGKLVAKQLIEKVSGATIPLLSELKARPVLRESCGCAEGANLFAIKDLHFAEQCTFPQWITGIFKDKLTINVQIVEQLYDAIQSIPSVNGSTIFLTTFNLFLESQSNLSSKKDDLQCFLYLFEKQFNRLFHKNEIVTVITQATVSIYVMIQRQNELEELRKQENYFEINMLNQRLHQTNSKQDFYEKCHYLLMDQNISSCAILLYEKSNMLEGAMHLAFAFNEQQFLFPGETSMGDLSELLQQYFKRKNNNVVILPLSLNGDQFGCLLLELDDELLEFTHSLSWHFAAILSRFQIMEEKEQKRVQLELTVKELRDTQQQLIESEKLASLGKLVAGVAHEINTPLGVSITYSSYINNMVSDIRKLLESNSLKKSELRAKLKQLNEAAEGNLSNLMRSAKLIDSFKSLAVEHDSSERSSFILKEVISDAILPLKARVTKSQHNIDISCPKNIFIHSYSKSIMQVVMGFIDNTLCHAYSEGEHGNISIKVSKKGEEILLIYTDDGMGITEKDRMNVFEPFFTTKRHRGHVGLGLSTIHNIIRRHLCGELMICNPAQGTKISVTFPIDIRNYSALNK